MLEKRTKIFILIFLILILVAIVNPPEIPRIDSPKRSNKNGEEPIRHVDIRLSLLENQHDQLFEQLRKFADKHAFAIRIAPTAAPDDRFLVQMWREDIKIIGLDGLDPGLFTIGFYTTDKDLLVPTWAFDTLIDDLRIFIDEIPDTKFIVQK